MARAIDHKGATHVFGLFAVGNSLLHKSLTCSASPLFELCGLGMALGLIVNSFFGLKRKRKTLPPSLPPSFCRDVSRQLQKPQGGLCMLFRMELIPV